MRSHYKPSAGRIGAGKPSAGEIDAGESGLVVGAAATADGAGAGAGAGDGAQTAASALEPSGPQLASPPDLPLQILAERERGR